MTPSTPVVTTAPAVALAVAAAVITAAVGYPLIGWLRERQIGKAIRIDGPAHSDKAGTPTMGGFAMIVAILLCAAALAIARAATGGAGGSGAGVSLRFGLFLPLAAGLLYGSLGLVDDLAGLARRSGRRELGVGLTARRSFAVQVALALFVALAIGPSIILQLPASLRLAIGGASAEAIAQTGPAGTGQAVAGLIVAAIAVLGCVNGVNLADGLDGLAAGLSALSLAAMAVATAVLTGTAVHRMIAAPSGSWVWPLPAALQLIAAGSCVGFLVHNRHPARLFMGNVGSMALGAILATASLQTGTWWLLPIVGSVFVAEVVSDVLQVAYFRLSHGRRLFRMAPLHHHFELGGHHEVQVVRRFWAAGAVAAACGLALIAWLTASPRP